MEAASLKPQIICDQTTSDACQMATTASI